MFQVRSNIQIRNVSHYLIFNLQCNMTSILFFSVFVFDGIHLFSFNYSLKFQVYKIDSCLTDLLVDNEKLSANKLVLNRIDYSVSDCDCSLSD